MIRHALVAVAGAALLLAACGGKNTMASKSAAAYREAVAKGTPVTGGGDHEHMHGGEAAEAMDHTAHGTMAGEHAMHGGAEHAQMDHGAMEHGAMQDHGTAPDHGAMQHGAAQDHTAMQHEAMQHDTMQHETMQHGTMQHGTAPDAHAQHAGHGAAPSPAANLALDAPNTSEEMKRTRPESTLQQDAFDAPAPIAVSEAQKAAGGGGPRGPGASGIGRSDRGTEAPRPRGPEIPAGHGAQSQVIYTCPMHPEVTSDKPGQCPICGMTLVKKE